MKQLYLNYEAPTVDAMTVESLDVLCQSQGGASNENFTDGNWDWEN